METANRQLPNSPTGPNQTTDTAVFLLVLPRPIMLLDLVLLSAYPNALNDFLYFVKIKNLTHLIELLKAANTRKKSKMYSIKNAVSRI